MTAHGVYKESESRAGRDADRLEPARPCDGSVEADPRGSKRTADSCESAPRGSVARVSGAESSQDVRTDDEQELSSLLKKLGASQ